MQLWAAEFRRAFTHEKRLILFHCPSNLNPSFIADGLRGREEYIYNLEGASDAMGLSTEYIDIKYTKRKRRKRKLNYYKIGK